MDRSIAVKIIEGKKKDEKLHSISALLAYHKVDSFMGKQNSSSHTNPAGGSFLERQSVS